VTWAGDQGFIQHMSLWVTLWIQAITGSDLDQSEVCEPLASVTSSIPGALSSCGGVERG
jgi:hypothetical protein